MTTAPSVVQTLHRHIRPRFFTNNSKTGNCSTSRSKGTSFLPELGWFVAQKRKQELDRSVQKGTQELQKIGHYRRVCVLPKVVAT